MFRGTLSTAHKRGVKPKEENKEKAFKKRKRCLKVRDKD